MFENYQQPPMAWHRKAALALAVLGLALNCTVMIANRGFEGRHHISPWVVMRWTGQLTGFAGLIWLSRTDPRRKTG